MRARSYLWEIRFRHAGKPRRTKFATLRIATAWTVLIGLEVLLYAAEAFPQPVTTPQSVPILMPKKGFVLEMRPSTDSAFGEHIAGWVGRADITSNFDPKSIEVCIPPTVKDGPPLELLLVSIDGLFHGNLKYDLSGSAGRRVRLEIPDGDAKASALTSYKVGEIAVQPRLVDAHGEVATWLLPSASSGTPTQGGFLQLRGGLISRLYPGGKICASVKSDRAAVSFHSLCPFSDVAGLRLLRGKLLGEDLPVASCGAP